MFKILILSLALVFTACQKSTDDSKGTESPQSQLGQKLFENQSQSSANSSELIGLWEMPPQNTDDGNGRVTARLQITKSHITSGAKCEFMAEGKALVVAYVGAESDLEYTAEKITFLSPMEQSVTLQNRSHCYIKIPAGRMSYTIDGGQLSICAGQKCLVMTKIAD